MNIRIAVVNAGASTLKLALIESAPGGSRTLDRIHRDWPPERRLDLPLQSALERIGDSPAAIGHRFVHGGSRFVEPVTVTSEVEHELEALVSLAPLHNGRALEMIRVLKSRYPSVPNVAVFDTAFHANRAEVSMRYALPKDWTEPLQIRRYGFHGIAHASLLEAAARAQGVDIAETTCVSLQLGAGCSACAIEGGSSIETSMGFTPLEGLVMATRCGDIDASIVLRLLRDGYEANRIEKDLTRRSGLLALCGFTDMREILEEESKGNELAHLAIELFCRRIVMTAGAYFTLLGGQGALVFGGGIGTNSPAVRERIARGLRAWDVAIDAAANERNATGLIGAPGKRPVLALETDEESLIARAVAQHLGRERGHPLP